MKFAKLYETEQHGQILVLLTENDECKPCVHVMMEARNGIVPQISSTFEDSEVGEAAARAKFDEFTEEMAIEVVDELAWAFDIAAELDLGVE